MALSLRSLMKYPDRHRQAKHRTKSSLSRMPGVVRSIAADSRGATLFLKTEAACQRPRASNPRGLRCFYARSAFLRVLVVSPRALLSYGREDPYP
jgi:hypothetical protein